MDEEPDLLAEMEGETNASVRPDVDDELFDLLDSISEDTGVAWQPHNDDEQPDGIQGKVTVISSVPTDAKYGEVSDVPLWTIETKDGDEWSVRGYGTVLRGQMEQADPNVGDFVAIKYFGVRQGKNNDYQNYKVVKKAR